MDRLERERLDGTSPLATAALAAVVLAIGLAAAGVIAACTETSAALRKHTYGPEFQYVTEDELEETMWTLALDATAIQDLLRERPEPDDAAREEIILRLENMERAAAVLAGSGRRSNHAVIDRHIEAFRRDVALARAAASGDRPAYFLAGSVTGSCLYCHDGRDRAPYGP